MLGYEQQLHCFGTAAVLRNSGWEMTGIEVWKGNLWLQEKEAADQWLKCGILELVNERQVSGIVNDHIKY